MKVYLRYLKQCKKDKIEKVKKEKKLYQFTKEQTKKTSYIKKNLFSGTTYLIL